jgi:hypothetical protein
LIKEFIMNKKGGTASGENKIIARNAFLVL